MTDTTRAETAQSEAARPPGMPDDPVRAARWRAIQAAGGASHVARTLGFQKGESVRLWYVDREPSAEQARALVRLSGNIVTLREILPAAYGGLTSRELGYSLK